MAVSHNIFVALVMISLVGFAKEVLLLDLFLFTKNLYIMTQTSQIDNLRGKNQHLRCGLFLSEFDSSGSLIVHKRLYSKS